LKSTNLSEEYIASIFRIEKEAEKETSVKTALLATCFHAGFLLDLFFYPEDGGDMFL
jgi:hypothetical protein